jgi:pimeloyl-ACP methyl ester carboxylesterase
VGTSLGGIIGMALAALPDSPVTKLVLNDVGAVLPAPSLSRIGSYVGKCPPLRTIEGAEAYVRSACASFGPHTDAEWRFLTEHVVRRNPDGTLRMHYDPALAVSFNARPSHRDLELWTFYDAVRCPTLVLRGEQSDVLTRKTMQEMTRRGPRARVVEFPGVGHPPTLIREEQIRAVSDFLLGS